MSPFYYKGKRSANKAANDFAIFQQLLKSFQGDSTYFTDNPKDLTYTLVCTSMGNQLLKRYMIKAYDRIIMIGSDAGSDSFEDGKGFHNITQMTDNVSILVNRRDGPLALSRYMNMKNRLGQAGPTNWEELPESIHILDVTSLIDWKDLSAMGHDYMLSNPDIRDMLLYEQAKFEKMNPQE